MNETGSALAHTNAAVRILMLLLISLCMTSCGTSPAPGGAAVKNEQEQTRTAEWFYDHFDRIQKDAYDAFRRSAEDPFSGELTEIVNAEGEAGQIDTDQLDSVYQGFLYDHPELFWLDRSYRFRIASTGEEGSADAVSVIPLYGSPEEIEERSERFMSAADDLLSSIGAAENDAAVPGALYDLVAGHAVYIEEAVYDPSLVSEHTAYGAIVEKRAVCDGYALALKYLMDRCGIECILVPGTVNGASHVWNTAYWDGAWHEMDITWDASSGSGRQYFDLTTEEMERDHLRDPEGAVPSVPVSAGRADGLFGNRLLYEQERNQS